MKVEPSNDADHPFSLVVYDSLFIHGNAEKERVYNEYYEKIVNHFNASFTKNVLAQQNMLMKLLSFQKF